MSYDAWKSTEPDEPWKRSAQCQKVGCDRPVTFPEFEVFCNEHLIEHERRQREIAEQMRLDEVAVRR